MKQKIYLRVQSYDKYCIQALIKNLKEIAFINNFFFSSISLPMRKKVYTVLKSPHVNKRAKDQFEIRFYNHLIVLEANSFSTFIMQQIRNCFDSKFLVKISFFS